MLEKFYKNRNSFDLFRTHLTSNLERGHQINIGDNNDLKKSEPSLWLIVFLLPPVTLKNVSTTHAQKILNQCVSRVCLNKEEITWEDKLRQSEAKHYILKGVCKRKEYFILSNLNILSYPTSQFVQQTWILLRSSNSDFY